MARNKYFFGAIFWTLFVTVSCLITAEKLNRISFFNVPYKDKYVHFAFYFIMVLLWVLSLNPVYKNKGKLRLYIFFSAIGYGILIEFCQRLFTQSRSADFFDVLANTAGAAAAVLITWFLNKIKK